MGWKIVRDNNRAWCEAHGVSGTWRPCGDPAGGLAKKLLEEVSEYLENRDRAELYDVADVLRRLIEVADPDGHAAAIHAVKVALLGGFENLTEWCPVPVEHLVEAVS